MKPLTIECEEGFQGEKTPRRFSLGGKWVEVRELVDCWLGHAQRYFKVRADDGDIYILRHDIELAEWNLTLFTREAYLTDHALPAERREARPPRSC